MHVLVDVDGVWKIRLQSGPFEGSATVKPRALPVDNYYQMDLLKMPPVGFKLIANPYQIFFKHLSGWLCLYM